MTESISSPNSLTPNHVEHLQMLINEMLCDISDVESLIVPMLNEASAAKNMPVVLFCHDVLQSLMTAPIYLRNITRWLKKDFTNTPGELSIDTADFINKFIHSQDTSLVEGFPVRDNLPFALAEISSHQHYVSFGISDQVEQLKKLSISLQGSYFALRELNGS